MPEGYLVLTLGDLRGNRQGTTNDAISVRGNRLSRRDRMQDASTVLLLEHAVVMSSYHDYSFVIASIAFWSTGLFLRRIAPEPPSRATARRRIFSAYPMVAETVMGLFVGCWVVFLLDPRGASAADTRVGVPARRVHVLRDVHTMDAYQHRYVCSVVVLFSLSTLLMLAAWKSRM